MERKWILTYCWGKECNMVQFSSVQLLSHVRLCDPMDCSMPDFPCPSPTPWAYSNSCPLSRWCHPTISSSVAPFSSCISDFSESVLCIRWPKYWSFSFPISLSNGYSGLISFRIYWLDHRVSKGLSRVFSSTTVVKHQFFSAQPALWSNSHICTWLLEKP